MMSISLVSNGNTQLGPTLCAGIAKPSTDYYNSSGNHVFTCFVDVSLAFDMVNYWTLFKQLIDGRVNRQLGCFASILVFSSTGYCGMGKYSILPILCK